MSPFIIFGVFNESRVAICVALLYVDKLRKYYEFTFAVLLPARRRPQGLVVIGVCLSVCAHCVCPQDISRTGSWITTKFGGWDQGVNL